jgi:BED zinc finger
MGEKAKSTKPRANASWVWNYFVVSGDGKYAKCKLCTVPGKGRLKIGGATTNFSNHLKSIHSLNENGKIAQHDDSSRSAASSDIEIVEEVSNPSISGTTKVLHGILGAKM